MNTKIPDKTIWLPQLFGVLDIFVLGYSDKPDQVLKNHCVAFFKGLSEMLPCDKCRLVYRMFLRKYDIKKFDKNINSLSRWVQMLKHYIQIGDSSLASLTVKEQERDTDQLLEEYQDLEPRDEENDNIENDNTVDDENVPVEPLLSRPITELISKPVIVNPVIVNPQPRRATSQKYIPAPKVMFETKQDIITQKAKNTLKRNSETSGTPVTNTKPANYRQLRALQRLQQSAKGFKRGCSC